MLTTLFNLPVSNLSRGWKLRGAATTLEGAMYDSTTSPPGGYTDPGSKPWCSVELVRIGDLSSPMAMIFGQTAAHTAYLGTPYQHSTVREFLLVFSGTPTQIATGGTQGTPVLGDEVWIGYDGTDVVGGLNSHREWSFTTALLTSGKEGGATLSFNAAGGTIKTGNMVIARRHPQLEMSQFAAIVGGDEDERIRQSLEAYYR